MKDERSPILQTTKKQKNIKIARWLLTYNNRFTRSKQQQKHFTDFTSQISDLVCNI